MQCNKCKQQYELLPEEKPEDFSSKCGCGGSLKHHLDDDKQYLKESSVGYDIHEVGKRDPINFIYIFELVIKGLMLLGAFFIAIILFPLGLIVLALIVYFIFFYKK
ncbi:hypothetical protein [Methanobacterium spitsbergense]|uniref:hypothetical protein n=1 Tax=Methanobacterium spitsbergense TaxID=2874285 RepID=UPI001CBD4AF4|nr:hypothetical protein [Methanobacterium spitsbergense]